MKGSILKLAGLLAWLMGGTAAMALTVGDQVPDISLPSTSGADVNLREIKQWTVLFFYPKAGTPGCTKQACGMRDSYAEMKKLGVVILGVSTDDLKSQYNFKEKQELPYELLADDGQTLNRAFDVLGVVGFSKRTTFIINPEGIITDVIDSVKVGTHDQDVLKILQKRLTP